MLAGQLLVVPGEVAGGGLVGDRALAAEQEGGPGLAPVPGGEAGQQHVLRDTRLQPVALTADLEGAPVGTGLRVDVHPHPGQHRRHVGDHAPVRTDSKSPALNSASW